MENDPFEIPDLLRLTREERAAAWKGRRLTMMKADKFAGGYDMPRGIEPAGKALQKELRGSLRALKATGSRR
jgi:hypothetical protein